MLQFSPNGDDIATELRGLPQGETSVIEAGWLSILDDFKARVESKNSQQLMSNSMNLAFLVSV
jgi:hypothetical protein